MMDRGGLDYYAHLDRPCKSCGKPSFPFEYCFDCMFKKPMQGPNNKQRLHNMFDNRRKLI